MKSERMFPILGPPPGCPQVVPWDLVAPFERQAQANHEQSLERLAERGGLGPEELVAIAENRPWREIRNISTSEAITKVKELVAAYEAKEVVQLRRKVAELEAELATLRGPQTIVRQPGGTKCFACGATTAADGHCHCEDHDR